MITVEWYGNKSIDRGVSLTDWLFENIGPGRYIGSLASEKIHKDDAWGYCASPSTLDSDWLFFFRDEESATLFKLTWL